MATPRLLPLLLLLGLARAAPAQAWETTYALRLLPFTGVVLSHQQRQVVRASGRATS